MVIGAVPLFNRLIKLFKTLVVVARIINVPLIGENNTLCATETTCVIHITFLVRQAVLF